MNVELLMWLGIGVFTAGMILPFVVCIAKEVKQARKYREFLEFQGRLVAAYCSQVKRTQEHRDASD